MKNPLKHWKRFLIPLCFTLSVSTCREKCCNVIGRSVHACHNNSTPDWLRHFWRNLLLFRLIFKGAKSLGSQPAGRLSSHRPIPVARRLKIQDIVINRHVYRYGNAIFLPRSTLRDFECWVRSTPIVNHSSLVRISCIFIMKSKLISSKSVKS